MFSIVGDPARARILLRSVLSASITVFAIDLRSLAAFRVLLAAALLMRVLGTLPEATAFLSDEGVLPRTTVLDLGFTDRTSLYFANGTPYFAIALLYLEALGAICLLIGFRPRVAAALCWVLHFSLAARNPFIGSGGDVLAPLLLFWAMFLPIGARFSLDAILAEPSAPKRILNVASAGLLLQASYVYFFGALLKTAPEWITDGSAVYLAMHNDAIATRFAHIVRPYVFVTQPLTFFVLWIELLTPFLLFTPVFNSRLRTIVLPLLIAMHLGFTFFLDIGNFWLVSIASLVAFIPSNFWEALGRRRRPSPVATDAVYYDRDCAFCRKVALLLRSLFVGRNVPILAAQDHGEIGDLLEREQSWVVTDREGNRFLKWDALVFLASQSRIPRLATLLGWIGRQGRGARLYDWIGRHRREFGVLTSVWSPLRAYRLSPVVQTLLAFVLAFCLLWNLTGLPGVERPRSLTGLGHVARGFGLTQTWGMFAPRPNVNYVLPVIEGRLADGRAVDVYGRRMGAPSYGWPPYPARALNSSYWTGYFDVVALRLKRTRATALADYARYACRDWNEQHPDLPLSQLRVTFLIGRTLSGYETDRSARQTYQFTCPGRTTAD